MIPLFPLSALALSATTVAAWKGTPSGPPVSGTPSAADRRHLRGRTGHVWQDWRVCGWRRERPTSVMILEMHQRQCVADRRTLLPENYQVKSNLTKLENMLTSVSFTGAKWLQSAEYLERVAVDLTSCVAAFDKSPHLPADHAAALAMVVRLCESCRKADHQAAGARERSAPSGLHSSVKHCVKKNGLGRAAAEVVEGHLPEYTSIRDRTVAVRAVERCLSEFCVAWSTARLLEARSTPQTKRDFLFHLRAILERFPARERHEAVLILCRGLFTPAVDAPKSDLAYYIHEAALDSECEGYPLAEAFAEVHDGLLDSPRSLRTARQAFPFLEILARWAWRCRTSNFKLQDERTSDPDQFADGRSGPALSSSSRRHRRDTGIAALVVALGEADPSGEAIRSMQRWACEALLPEQVGQAPWSAIGTEVDRNEVARCLTCTRDTFVSRESQCHLRWLKACREVGDVLQLLVAAMTDERLQGDDLVSAANRAMFVTTFLRSMPEGSKPRRGYERLIGSGRVPGEVPSFGSERGARERITTWREASEVLELSMATVLRVSERQVRSEAFREALETVLRNWRSPHALADYYNMQQKSEVIREYLRFLRALLRVSEENVHNLRFRDPANAEHMQYVPERARRLWEAEPCPLAGTSDPEVIFRMGDDTRSCMGIRRACCKTNGALLGYLLQGNVRFVGVQSACGRMEARAVLRLLLRADNMVPVLFMDEIFYASNRDTALEQQVLLEAKSVSDALDIPLYRAGDSIPRSSPRRSADAGYFLRSAESRIDETALAQESTKMVPPTSKDVCQLIEVNGLSTFVYSDAPLGTIEKAGVLQRGLDRDKRAARALVLAELAYAEDDR